jgi:hypothetical protein
MWLPWLKVSGGFVELIPTASRIARLVTAHSEDYERASGSEAVQAGFGKQFWALVCARLGEEQEYQSRLGSDKRSLQFIIATHCAIKYFNNQY